MISCSHWGMFEVPAKSRTAASAESEFYRELMANPKYAQQAAHKWY